MSQRFNPKVFAATYEPVEARAGGRGRVGVGDDVGAGVMSGAELWIVGCVLI